jgi:hypothetical protein
MRLTPQVLLIRASQTDSMPIPIGVATPKPVITTRRSSVMESRSAVWFPSRRRPAGFDRRL